MGEKSLLPTRRVALLVEYDGTDFFGVQRQRQTGRTIQEEIEKAVRQVGSAEPRFACAGRTDAGVHATGQVVAIDLPERLEERRVGRALNALLPPSIRIRKARDCAPDFHPRFDARQRLYIYRFIAGEPVPPILRSFVAQVNYKLNGAKTRAAAEAFRGRWELGEWRSSQCQAKRTLLNIDECEALPPGALDPEDPWEGCWRVRVAARSFLHHQVRFMVGGIVAVGSGRLALEELRGALAEGRRPDIVKKEAASGLCLVRTGFAEGRDPFAGG